MNLRVLAAQVRGQLLLPVVQAEQFNRAACHATTCIDAVEHQRSATLELLAQFTGRARKRGRLAQHDGIGGLRTHGRRRQAGSQACGGGEDLPALHVGLLSGRVRTQVPEAGSGARGAQAMVALWMPLGVPLWMPLWIPLGMPLGMPLGVPLGRSLSVTSLGNTGSSNTITTRWLPRGSRLLVPSTPTIKH